MSHKLITNYKIFVYIVASKITLSFSSLFSRYDDRLQLYIYSNNYALNINTIALSLYIYIYFKY